MRFMVVMVVVGVLGYKFIRRVLSIEKDFVI